MTPVFKRAGRNSKDNYRRVSIPPNISKISQYIFSQLHSFMREFLSKYQCGFRKGYCMQYCLVAKLEKWKSAIDKKNQPVHYLEIRLRHLTVFLTNFCLLNFMSMDLAL